MELLTKTTPLKLSFKYYINKFTCGRYFNTNEIKILDIVEEKINKVYRF